MVDLPLAPFVAHPGLSGRYIDTPWIAAFDLADDWGVTALAAAVDWTAAAGGTILGQHNLAADKGIAFYVKSTGVIAAFHGDGVTSREVTFPDPGFLDGTTHLLNLEWDNATPLVSLSIDGAAYDTDTPVNSDPGVGSGEDLHIGSNPGGTAGLWLGGIYYVELRDDAGDPIARADAVDALAAV